MRAGASRSCRHRLVLPVLAVLCLTAAGLVSHLLLACGELEEVCTEQAVLRARTAVRVRTRVARARRGLPATSGALVVAPRDQREVRAMVRFCDTAGPADVPALREAALTATDALSAANAVRALGRLDAVAGDAELLRLLTDDRRRVHEETILALGESRNPAVLDLLEPLVLHGDEGDRILAIRAVGRVGGERSRRLLESLASGPPLPAVASAFVQAAITAAGRR